MHDLSHVQSHFEHQRELTHTGVKEQSNKETCLALNLIGVTCCYGPHQYMCNYYETTVHNYFP